jgi:hypothetical protein
MGGAGNGSIRKKVAEFAREPGAAEGVFALHATGLYAALPR